MKPPQLLDTHLPCSTVLLLLSIPSAILRSPDFQHIKGLEEKHGDSLGRLFDSPVFIFYRNLTPGFLVPTMEKAVPHRSHFVWVVFRCDFEACRRWQGHTGLHWHGVVSSLQDDKLT
ncbi:hypothetical protein NQZ68_017957 [Dissostichus eleginoides]|uniref:Myosin-52 n=1 Tax=Dissostichus eleginoides TaxID=100907 RepID=A0AAD9BU88_DISEL|nr:hypothetical protein NQZ68_017957 [Dissostichus eleginoides]KAK1890070.1 Myosin-52 [Dissostichus eleginoides]